MGKLNGFIGMLGYSGLVHYFWGYQLYMLYQILANKSIENLRKMAIIYFYQTMFAKKSEIFQNFLKKFRPTDWLSEWTEVFEEEPQKEGALYPHHPHSIYCLPMHFNTSRQESRFNEIDLISLGAKPIFITAPGGFVAKWNGFQEVNPENFTRLMKQRKNLAFIPGGFEEATITSNKEYRILLETRKGFIKYALQYGYKIYPTFIFNENKLFNTSDILLNQRLLLNTWKIPGVFYYGKYGFMPDPKARVNVVVGKGLDFGKIDNPTPEQVSKYHAIYTQELINLFNRHVEKYDPGAKLIIWDAPKPNL